MNQSGPSRHIRCFWISLPTFFWKKSTLCLACWPDGRTWLLLSAWFSEQSAARAISIPDEGLTSHYSLSHPLSTQDQPNTPPPLARWKEQQLRIENLTVNNLPSLPLNNWQLSLWCSITLLGLSWSNQVSASRTSSKRMQQSNWPKRNIHPHAWISQFKTHYTTKF